MMADIQDGLELESIDLGLHLRQQHIVGSTLTLYQFTNMYTGARVIDCYSKHEAQVFLKGVRLGREAQRA